jgi:hypothetical protein
MTSGKCPHPWNKNKKGTFSEGHKQINDGKGCFMPGRVLTEDQEERRKESIKNYYQSDLSVLKAINEMKHNLVLEMSFHGRHMHNFYMLGKCEWYKLRKKVFDRDNRICRKCKKDLHGKRADCHHKIPWIISKDNSMKNLETLCPKCHGEEEFEIWDKIQKSPKNPKNI